MELTTRNLSVASFGDGSVGRKNCVYAHRMSRCPVVATDLERKSAAAL